MMPCLKSIISALAADSVITDDLDVFDFGSGDAPAIFARARPIEAGMRDIVVTMIGGVEWGANGLDGARVQHDIRIEDDKTRSDKIVREIAWAVFWKFNKSSIDVDGYGDSVTQAIPPQDITDPSGFPAYLVRVTVWLLKDA
jgi:hypothetical protein